MQNIFLRAAARQHVLTGRPWCYYKNINFLSYFWYIAMSQLLGQTCAAIACLSSGYLDRMFTLLAGKCVDQAEG